WRGCGGRLRQPELVFLLVVVAADDRAGGGAEGAADQGAARGAAARVQGAADDGPGARANDAAAQRPFLRVVHPLTAAAAHSRNQGEDPKHPPPPMAGGSFVCPHEPSPCCP